jgi:hypothetical protein
MPNKYSTKANSIQQYVDLYQGEEYYMHFKYASMMNITYVTFMYGAGLPILFFYAFLAHLVLYHVEKISFYYIYKMPPMYDESTLYLVMQYYACAPYLLLSFSYWMLSNNQMWNRELTDLDSYNSNMLSGHLYHDVVSSDGYIGPERYLIYFIVLFLIGEFIYKFQKQIKKCLFG